MAYAVEFEVPGDAELYGRVKAAIGDEHPHGLIVHLVVKTPAGLRHIEVWDTLEQHDRFHADRVEPAVHGVLQSIGFSEMPPEHDLDELDLIDIELAPAS